MRIQHHVYLRTTRGVHRVLQLELELLAACLTPAGEIDDAPLLAAFGVLPPASARSVIMPRGTYVLIGEYISHAAPRLRVACNDATGTRWLDVSPAATKRRAKRHNPALAKGTGPYAAVLRAIFLDMHERTNHE